MGLREKKILRVIFAILGGISPMSPRIYVKIGQVNIIFFKLSILGNCYTFNSGFNLLGNKIDLIQTNTLGSSGTLTMALYVNTHENLSTFNSFMRKSSGAILRIENNSYLTDNSFGEKNIQLASGSDVTIRVHRSFEFSLEEPYSNCEIPNDSQDTGVKTNFFYRLFAKSPYQYTRQACLVQCWQQSLIENCNCTDPEYLTLFNHKQSCTTGDQFICKWYFLYDWSWDICLGLCPLECNQTKYTTFLSSLQLTGHYYFHLIRKKSNLLNDYVTHGVDKEMAAKSIVRLAISYDSLAYDIIEETVKLKLVDLIASIGGNLSLFLGMSIFSIFEIFEIFIEFFSIREAHKKINSQ